VSQLALDPSSFSSLICNVSPTSVFHLWCTEFSNNLQIQVSKSLELELTALIRALNNQRTLFEIKSSKQADLIATKFGIFIPFPSLGQLTVAEVLF